MSETPETAHAETPAPVAEETKSGIESLPEWAQKELKAVRKEAAGYREKLREAEPLISKAAEEIESTKSDAQKLMEALESVKRENDEFRTTIHRERVLSEFELPAEAAKFLTGDAESMKTTAERLKGLLGTAPKSDTTPLRTTPVANLQSGASAPLAEDDGFDPQAIAKRLREKRASF